MTRSRFRLPTVGLWTSALDGAPSSRARDLAAELESLGYGMIWIPEVAGRDPFIHLSMLLSATKRLIGATGIASIWARDAVTTSSATKTLTEAYPERVLIGLGVSHEKIVNTVRGHNYEKPLSAMREYLDAIEAAPFTAARPTTPTRYVLAALRPKMLGLAAERTEGAHPYFVTPQYTSRARETLGPEPLLCPEQAVILEPDPAKAREIGRRFAQPYLALPNYVNNFKTLGFSEEDVAEGGSDAFIDAMIAWGNLDTVVTRVKEHLQAGADHVAVQVLPPETRGVPDDQWRELAAPLASLVAD